MLTEEYGLPHQVRSPWIAAASTFIAFLICGLVPLIPFIFNVSNAFPVGAVLTGAVFFTIGSVKSIWSTSRWWRSGLATLAVGGVAAALAYIVGRLLKGFA